MFLQSRLSSVEALERAPLHNNATQNSSMTCTVSVDDGAVCIDAYPAVETR